MDQRGLSGDEVAVVEQRLPGREGGLRQRCGLHVIDGGRGRRNVAGLDGDELRGGAVAVVVDQPIHLVADGHPGGAVSERDDHAGELLAWDQRCAVASGTVGVQRPEQLVGGDPARMHPDQHVADRRCGIRRVLVDETIDADGCRDPDRSHRLTSSHTVDRRARSEFRVRNPATLVSDVAHSTIEDGGLRPQRILQ